MWTYKNVELWLTRLGLANMTGIGAAALLWGLNPMEVLLAAVQLLILLSAVLNKSSRFRREACLMLDSRECLHEKKRHYQVALALIELGQPEQAASYIETIMKEIA